jgi:glycosyltransferase involved in cell wall biosynthesis
MSKKCKIALLCGSDSWGGLEMNVLRLAKWLRGRGHTVSLYTAPGSQLADGAYTAGLNVREIARQGKYGGLFSARRLASSIKADGVEFLLIQTNGDIFISALAKSLGKHTTKFIYMQHMQIGKEKKDLVHTWEYSRLDAWISPLKLLADTVVAMTNIDPNKIRVVPLGMELERFTSGLPSQEAARKQLSIPLRRIVAGAIGRIDRLKGQDVLIKACSLVHQKDIPLHLLIVGDRTRGEAKSYADEIQSLTERLGLSDHVTFSPFMESIEAAYAALDIFVLPSHSETYGMVTIEAMASGKAVVATNSGGTPGIVRDGENGLLVPPRDGVALAEALMRLIRDKQLAHGLASQARKDASEGFSHHRTIEQLEEVLQQL